MITEFGGMIRHYLAADGAPPPAYEVLIVPHSHAQVDVVQISLPGATEKMVRGGRVFSAGTYFSEQYAELVRQKYIAPGLFTAIRSGAESGAVVQPA
jgi:hypothetical protein